MVSGVKVRESETSDNGGVKGYSGSESVLELDESSEVCSRSLRSKNELCKMPCTKVGSAKVPGDMATRHTFSIEHSQFLYPNISTPPCHTLHILHHDISLRLQGMAIVLYQHECQMCGQLLPRSIERLGSVLE